MNKSQHTPGPWKVLLDPRYAVYVIGTHSDGDGMYNAICFTKKRDANAHLIAAAPDMLEALKEITGNTCKSAHEMNIEIAKRAITKAEGKG